MSFAFVRFTLWTLSGRRPGARPVSPAVGWSLMKKNLERPSNAGETIRTLVRKEDFRCPRPGTTTRKQRSWVFFLVSPRECLPVAGLKPTLQRPVQTLPRDHSLAFVCYLSFHPSHVSEVFFSYMRWVGKITTWLARRRDDERLRLRLPSPSTSYEILEVEGQPSLSLRSVNNLLCGPRALNHEPFFA